MTDRTHEQRMAGLTADARNVSLGPRGIRLLGELRDYCNDLAAQLEAERSKAAELAAALAFVHREQARGDSHATPDMTAKCAVSGYWSKCEQLRESEAELKQSEAKLQAAERVISKLREEMASMDYCILCGGERYEAPGEEHMEHADGCALDAYDLAVAGEGREG